MIQIFKDPCPPKLEKLGKPRTDELKLEYDKGGRKLKFYRTYKIKAVVEALKHCQHNKCCFSEAYFVGDLPPVEHYRPKGRIDEWPWRKGGSLTPGYYWLAYSWENLLLCKPLPNTSKKRNFFPLVDSTKRMKSHHDADAEEPILINPSKEDPRCHIRFRGWEIEGRTFRGRQTIKILGLRDESFVIARQRLHFRLLKEMQWIEALLARFHIDKDDPIILPTRIGLLQSMKPESEFSSMAIDLLSGWPHL